MGDDYDESAHHQLAPISIHVPRMGDDPSSTSTTRSRSLFLSTSPVWGTTWRLGVISGFDTIFLSTSPVWGTTPTPTKRSGWLKAFLSTSPVWGTTKHWRGRVHIPDRFLSTSPVWGTTDKLAPARQAETFLSTAPVWGSTAYFYRRYLFQKDFYPRPPYGGRHQS